MAMRVLLVRAVASTAAVWLGLSCSTTPIMDNTVTQSTVLTLKTLSNRADLISGGDALVEIVLPPDVESWDGLHVAFGPLGGDPTTDVSSSFARGNNGRILARIEGLPAGISKVSADLGGKHTASLLITNHPIGGPVISGPQVTPFICATPRGSAATAGAPATNPSGLSTMAIDDQCNIATEVKLFYRTTATPVTAMVDPGECLVLATPDPDAGIPLDPTACFKPYNLAAPPSDVATITTDAGVTMPFVVRVERGTLNRGVYELVVLFDPVADKDLGALASPKGWNHKVLYTFGASSGQPRLQFRSERHWFDEEEALRRGYLVALNSMTDSAFNSNRVLMSETVMMMKEKIIESFGEIKFTMGDGCSGGSINQLTTASIFPGLLDGLQSSCTYPDAETTGIEVGDCALLVNAYNSPAWNAVMLQENLDRTKPADQKVINAKKAAINGHLDQTACHAWVNLFASLGKPGNYIKMVVKDDATGDVVPDPANPDLINNCSLPLGMVFSPGNKTGVRCSVADHAVALFGKVKDGNAAKTTADNVGVQYGLKALLADTITAEEFVTLNEVIGGVDIDNTFVAARSVADPDALDTAYRAGLVTDGKQLAQTPIIDLRGFDDAGGSAGTGIHHIWRSFALRARLDAANMDHSNHVMWRFGPALSPAPAAMLPQQSFAMMDQWLTAIKADSGTASLAAKVTSNKPAAAFDFCYLTSDTTFMNKLTDPAKCDLDAKLKPHSSPRQVAGGPPAEDILKCQLKPLNAADYAGKLTPMQIDRLKAIFKDGVCDFAKLGVGQQPAVSPLDFSAGPGGVALPDPPGTRGP